MRGFVVQMPNDDPFWIAPLGDIQWNGHEEDIAFTDLKEHIQTVLALPGEKRFIGMADYIDYASPSSRLKITRDEPYDNTMRVLDDAADSLVAEVHREILAPTDGLWAGLLSGHHLWKYQSGMLSDHKLAERLKCPHMGMDLEGAVIQFNIPTSRNTRTVRVWAHHGVGAGEESTLLLRMKKIAADYQNIDIFLHGHVTKVASTVIPKLEPVFAPNRDGTYSFRFVERRVALVGTGGWQKAYGSQVTYVEKRLMRPVSLGAPLIQVIPHFARDYHGDSDTRRWLPKFKLILQ